MTPQQLNAMKLALEALKKCHYYMIDAGLPNQSLLNEAFTAYKALETLAEHAMRETQRLGQEIEQEPVAIKRMKEWIEYLKRKSDFGQHMKIPSEMSAGACWELALELEQFINTTPPQRTWVGLTKEQIAEFGTWHDNREEEVGWVNPSEIVAYIDAKLKEKNT